MKLPDAVEEEISAWVMSEEAMAADTLPTAPVWVTSSR